MRRVNSKRGREGTSPNVIGKVHFYQKSAHYVKKVAMFAFYNDILLRGVRACSLRENAIRDVEVF